MLSDKVIDKPEIFPHKGLLFEVEYTVNKREGFRISEPRCANCVAKITFYDNDKGMCRNCGKTYSLEEPYEEIRAQAHTKLDAFLTSKKQIVSLDLPPGATEEKFKYNDYFIVGKIGQKNGRKMAVIYIGEQLDQQSSKDKIQLFLDIEEGQIRFDRNNMNPVKLLSKMQIEFKDRTIITEFEE